MPAQLCFLARSTTVSAACDRPSSQAEILPYFFDRVQIVGRVLCKGQTTAMHGCPDVLIDPCGQSAHAPRHTTQHRNTTTRRTACQHPPAKAMHRRSMTRLTRQSWTSYAPAHVHQRPNKLASLMEKACLLEATQRSRAPKQTSTAPARADTAQPVAPSRAKWLPNPTRKRRMPQQHTRAAQDNLTTAIKLQFKLSCVEQEHSGNTT
jgi:hypothetical protein